MNNYYNDRHNQNAAKAYVQPRIERRQLRRWQEKAVRHYSEAAQREYLLTGTPGSGNSTVAAEIARRLMEQGKIDRIVIVAPTAHLKYQLTEALHKVGIALDPTWQNSSRIESSDAQGKVVTYSQVSADPDLYDFHCRERRTLVILDEIHHTADGLDWGNKLRRAFGCSAFVLGLSGTLFRHDHHAIPFVRYDRSGKSVADFSYSYGEALADGICRPVMFPVFEGTATWYDGSGNWQSQEEFKDLSRKDSAELLRVLLEPSGNWLETVSREANEKLTEFRMEGHPDAGGLVIARDQGHARKVAALLEKIAGEAATLVISEDPESDRALHEFKEEGNMRRWIVAVKMVSEGIDIPRLRVGVYATTTLTELAFRQAVGRFVRVIAGLGEQHAAFYMPAHPALVKYALAIKEGRDHVLASPAYQNRGSVQTALGEANATPQQPGSCGPSDADSDEDGMPGRDNYSDGQFIPPSMGLGQNNAVSDGSLVSGRIFVHVKTEARFEQTIFDGRKFSDEELKNAAYFAAICGLDGSPEKLAAYLQLATGGKVSNGKNVDCSPAANQNFDARDSYSAGYTNSASRDSLPRNYSQAEAELVTDPKQKHPVKSAEPVLMLHERKKVLRDVINKTEARLAGLTGKKPGNYHSVWARELKQTPQNIASVADLEKKLDWLNKQLREVESGKVTNTGIDS